MASQQARFRGAKLAVALLILALGVGGLMAGVMSGGLLEIVKGFMGGAGNAALSGGTLALSHSVGQPNVITMTGGAFELSSGYQMESPKRHEQRKGKRIKTRL